MVNLAFLVSGEYETLSFSELIAILETEGYQYKITEKLDQTIRLAANLDCISHVLRRSAFTRICLLELFTCNANDESITKALSELDFQNFLSKEDSFEVRIRRIKEYATKEATMENERLLGKLILQSAPFARVDLKKAKKTFFGILTNEKLVFGIKLGEIIPKPFVERRARKKPFFHPSAMNAKLARCMVNLAHAKSGEFVLDPFSGTGTTLIEASLIGCKTVGIDVKRKMAEGSIRNMRHFGLNPDGLILADARKLPFSSIDCVVTDPPYGKSSTTLKIGTKTLVEGILNSTYELLGKGKRICIASPKTLCIERIGKKIGYKHLESHFAYVHRTLTREIAVFEKE